MTIRLIGLLALLSLPLPGFAAPTKVSRPSEDNLTHELAIARKKQVKSVRYDLSFKFEMGREDFEATTVMELELADTKSPLSIDFVGKEIRYVKVNGTVITGYGARKGSFDIPAASLAPHTKIEVMYVGEFNKEGMSFQRVVDPEDKAEYLYSDFEPFYAHGLFPCFDQPDLKATFDVQVEGPKDWKVISNALVERTDVVGDRATTVFKRGPKISTYLFFLGTGPFVEWTDKLGDLPLVIYARKSLARYVDADALFDTTKKGLRFYSDYFGYAYPFPKFGMVYIPEFNWGGMENPGAIAFNEKGIYRGKVTEAERHHRDGLILHEMAHMWFGDLVTMQWWNDLWLNESFASYAATLAQDRAMGYPGTWPEFYSEKRWGYWQDELVTTHPIETNVLDTRTAKSNFDGITYAKGAATLKQLHFFVGEDGFKNGIQAYFKKYAFGNAIRENFISSISDASKTPLIDWTRAWLQTAGPNRVHADWKCDAGKVSSFSIIQEPSVSKSLSPHRTRVGLFSAKAGESLKLLTTQDVAYLTKATPVPALVGKECPDFVFPNIDDQDFALFALDPTSLKSVKAAMTQNPDTALRLMTWGTLAQMVRDAKLPVGQFYEQAMFALETESDDALLSILLGKYGDLTNFYGYYLTPEQRKEMAPRLEALIWKRIQSSDSGSSRQLLFYEFYVTVAAHSDDALAKLQGLLAGKDIPKGIEMDQDRRWDVIQKLASEGFYSGRTTGDGLRNMIENEAARDPSTAGKRNAYVANASIPDPANKERVWKEFELPKQIPPSTLRQATREFHNPDYPAVTQSYLKRYFAKVNSIDWAQNDSYVEMYFEHLFPGTLCSSGLLKESQAQLSRAKNLTSISRRSWREANDELERCIRVRALEAQSHAHRTPGSIWK